jgi:hypothetical protein
MWGALGNSSGTSSQSGGPRARWLTYLKEDFLDGNASAMNAALGSASATAYNPTVAALRANVGCGSATDRRKAQVAAGVTSVGSTPLPPAPPTYRQ